MRMKMSVSGLNEFRDALSDWFSRCPQELGKSLYEEGEEIIGDSKENYVPVDLAALKNSGYVELPKETGSSIVVELGFGGVAAPYALIVHENLEAYHEVGQAKYLEIPFLERAALLPEQLAAKAQELLDD